MEKKEKKGGVVPMKPLNDVQRQLVSDNVRFAMNIGRRFAGLGRLRGLDVDELQQEACYGLCIAALRYNMPVGDEGCGVDADRETEVTEPAVRVASFTTYAYNWCRKFVMMAINKEEPTLSADDEGMDDILVADDANGDDEQCGDPRVMRVQEMRGMLQKRERDVVCLIYGLSYGEDVANHEPKDFKEVAQLLHLSSARVHQLYEQALAKMERKLK